MYHRIRDTGLARKDQASVVGPRAGQYHVAGTGHPIVVGGVLAADQAGRGAGQGAPERELIDLAQSHLAVMRGVGGATQAGHYVVGEKRTREIVGLLRQLVGRRRGHDGHTLDAAGIGQMDLVAWRTSATLHAGECARLAGIDECDAHVGPGKLFEIRTQVAQGQARRSQLKGLLITMAGVVEKKERAFALGVSAIELRPRGGQRLFNRFAPRPLDGDDVVEFTRAAKQAGQLAGFGLGKMQNSSRVVPQIVADHDCHAGLLGLRASSALPQRQDQASA